MACFSYGALIEPHVPAGLAVGVKVWVVVPVAARHFALGGGSRAFARAAAKEGVAEESDQEAAEETHADKTRRARRIILEGSWCSQLRSRVWFARWCPLVSECPQQRPRRDRVHFDSFRGTSIKNQTGQQPGRNYTVIMVKVRSLPGRL